MKLAILNLVEVSKYFGGLQALQDVSLSVERGDIFGLIGPNGAGKTTLFNVISGYYRADKGRVILKGQDVTNWKVHRKARHGMVRTFQASVLFCDHSAFDNVLVACHLQRRASFFSTMIGSSSAREEEPKLRKRTMEILEYMGLADVRGLLANSLPHGYQKALEIAMALACDPEILLLDEPASGLNPLETETIMKLIRGIRDQGRTILLVEHHMQLIMGICDRIAVLNFGRKIAEGTREQILGNKDVIQAYLGKGLTQDVA